MVMFIQSVRRTTSFDWQRKAEKSVAIHIPSSNNKCKTGHEKQNKKQKDEKNWMKHFGNMND